MDQFLGARSQSIKLPRGFTEEMIIRRLISDYDERIADMSSHRGLKDAWEHDFHASLDEAVETNLGLRGGKPRYLIVSVTASTGPCVQCYMLRVGLFEISSKALLWDFGEEGIAGPANITPFRMSPDDPFESVSIHHGIGSTGCCDWESMSWFAPSLSQGRVVGMDEAWTGLVETYNQGNRGGSALQGCATMSPSEDGREWTYVLSIYYAEEPKELFDELSVESAGDEEWTLDDLAGDKACSPCPDTRGCGGIEIRKIEKWKESSPGSGLLERKSFRAFRIDHAESMAFPFSLPVNEDVRWQSTSVSTRGTGVEGIRSPDGEFLACLDDRRFNQALLVTGPGGLPWRRVSLDPSGNGDYFEPDVAALGWSADSSRILVVVNFGQDDSALLSFGVTDDDDFWEELLSGLGQEWQDGFVLEAIARDQADTD